MLTAASDTEYRKSEYYRPSPSMYMDVKALSNNWQIKSLIYIKNQNDYVEFIQGMQGWFFTNKKPK